MDKRLRDNILSIIEQKTALKNDISKITNDKFEELKSVLKSIVLEYNQLLEQSKMPDLQLSTKMLGDHVIQLEVADDTLLFVHHNSIFQFDRDHNVWQKDYVKEDPTRTYSGIISVYNFLSDSFRYDRDDDLGYMIARLFINKESCFFVEGKRQRGMGVDHFGSSKIDASHLRKIVETSMRYAIEFDLLTPPYDDVKILDLIHMKLEVQSSKMKTGKRLGFLFNSDDVR